MAAFLQMFKPTNHSNFILFKIAIHYGVSLSTNIQIFKSFKLSFIQDSCSVWRQPSYKHSYLQIIQNFFYSRQHCSVASAFSIHTAISSEIAFLVGVNAESIHNLCYSTTNSVYFSYYYSSAAFFRSAYLQHTSSDLNRSNFILLGFIRTLSETFKIFHTIHSFPGIQNWNSDSYSIPFKENVRTSTSTRNLQPIQTIQTWKRSA